MSAVTQWAQLWTAPCLGCSALWSLSWNSWWFYLWICVFVSEVWCDSGAFPGAWSSASWGSATSPRPVPWFCPVCLCPHHQATKALSVSVPYGSLGTGSIRVTSAHPTVSQCKEWWWSSHGGGLVSAGDSAPLITLDPVTECVPVWRVQVLGVAYAPSISVLKGVW